MKTIALLILCSIFVACNQESKETASGAMDTAAKPNFTQEKKSAQPILHTDTLQYIHFEGNFDYWYSVFIDKKKDTVQLVVDEQLPARYRQKLVEVKWFNDTLTEAGDNEAKYAGKRLKSIRLVNGQVFAVPPTDQKVVKDIESLPEVQANADRVGIAERPTDDKEYYLVETGTHEDGRSSRLFMFRVYVYPTYEIKFYDLGQDTELSLEAWRKTLNK